MMHQFLYGESTIDLDLTGLEPVDVIAPMKVEGSHHPLQDVEQALKSFLDINPIPFYNFKSVAIGINDKTRPVPHAYLLPPLLTILKDAGIAREHIHLIIASGIHKPMKASDLNQILPEDIIAQYPIIAHDCDHSDMVTLGDTSRGTPVIINREFYESDLKITIGNIEPHHFMGYSGGAKTAAIGLAGRKTINHNHAFITHPNAISGHFEDNPMRQDVEEIGQMIGLHLAVNAILNSAKEILHVLAGNPLSVMKAGIPLSRQLNEVTVNSLYDLVIVSPGGYPKDINFYQSQKALTHAGLMTRVGGDILLLAECSEGIGNSGYERTMHSIKSQSEALQYQHEHEFEVGPHKAYLVARDAVNKNIHIHSSLTDEAIRLLLLDPVLDPQQFISHYHSMMTKSFKVALLPFGTTTIPHLTHQETTWTI
jgi:nickel-dependent lactate racemase